MSVFRRVAPSSDAAIAAQVIQLLSEALSKEGLANYFTRRDEKAAARLWAELLQLTLAASAATSTPQLCHLADCTAAAVVQQYPQDRAGWQRGSVLLRLAKLAPWGKWRALREALSALDKQKAAFYASHGPFLYLAALGVAPDFRAAGLGTVLLDHICRMADEQHQPVYAEVTDDRVRGWLRRHGFVEQMRHAVRPHAPPVYVQVRWPLPPDLAGGIAGGIASGGGSRGSMGAEGGGTRGRTVSSSGGSRTGLVAGPPAEAPQQAQQGKQQVGEAQQARPVLRPTGSVRTR